MKKLFTIIILLILIPLSIWSQSMGISTLTPKYKEAWLKVYQGEEAILTKKNVKRQKNFKRPAAILEHLLWKYTPETECEISRDPCTKEYLATPLEKWSSFLGKYSDINAAKDFWIKLEHCFQMETMEGNMEGILKYKLYDGDKLLLIDGISIYFQNGQWVVPISWTNDKKDNVHYLSCYMQTEVLAYMLYPEMEDLQPVSFVKKIKKEVWQEGALNYDLFFYNYILPWIEEKNTTKLSQFFELPLMNGLLTGERQLKFVKWWD